jgi:hypothetical protein
MRILTILLTGILTITSIRGFASEGLPQIKTAKQLLKAQYAELEDLKTQVKHAQRVKKMGWIGVAISSTAVAASLLIARGGGGLGVPDGAGIGSMNIPAPSVTGAHVNSTDFMFLGGLGGAASSGVVIYIQSGKLKDLELKINVIQQQLVETAKLLN